MTTRTQSAADIMSGPLVTASPDTPLTEAIRTIVDKGVGLLPVVDDDNRLLGVLTEYDVVNFAFSGSAADTRVSEAMTDADKVVTFAPNAPLEEIVSCFLSQRIHRVPIVADGVLQGIVTRRDVLRSVMARYI